MRHALVDLERGGGGTGVETPLKIQKLKKSDKAKQKNRRNEKR